MPSEFYVSQSFSVSGRMTKNYWEKKAPIDIIKYIKLAFHFNNFSFRLLCFLQRPTLMRSQTSSPLLTPP